MTSRTDIFIESVILTSVSTFVSVGGGIVTGFLCDAIFITPVVAVVAGSIATGLLAGCITRFALSLFQKLPQGAVASISVAVCLMTGAGTAVGIGALVGISASTALGLLLVGVVVSFVIAVPMILGTAVFLMLGAEAFGYRPAQWTHR